MQKIQYKLVEAANKGDKPKTNEIGNKLDNAGNNLIKDARNLADESDSPKTT